MSFSADEEMRFQASCKGGRGQCRQTQFSCSVAGKLFHTRAPATAKARPPRVRRRVVGTSRADVGLEEGGMLKKLSLCYSIVYYYNGAQRYEQFLQVGRLDRTLILLGLALYLPSTSVSLVFVVFSLLFGKLTW